MSEPLTETNLWISFVAKAFKIKMNKIWRIYKAIFFFSFVLKLLKKLRKLTRKIKMTKENILLYFSWLIISFKKQSWLLPTREKNKKELTHSRFGEICIRIFVFCLLIFQLFSRFLKRFNDENPYLLPSHKSIYKNTRFFF